jgi:hypothetical protein
MRPRGGAAVAVVAALACAQRSAAWYLPGVAPKVRGVQRARWTARGAAVCASLRVF